MRAWSAADRALVDRDDLVDPLGAFDGAVQARLGHRPVEALGEGAVEDVVHEGRFAGAGDSRHRGEGADRDRGVDVAEVVGARPEHADLPARDAPRLGKGDLELAPDVAAGQAAVQGRGRALVHHAAAQAARSFAEVHDPVGGADRLLVVLHHHHRVAVIADALEGCDEPLVVALVQAHRGLVEDVQDALHAGPDLGGQADAVGLAAGEGRGGAVQGQVAQPERLQELEAGDDLLHDAVGHRPLALAERETGEQRTRVGDREARRTRPRSGRPAARPGSRAGAARRGTPGRAPR